MAETASAGLVKRAVYQNRLLSRKGILERAFNFWFDSFVYNQIWEDPRVDMEALALDGQSRVLTIASGGCNVLNYLIARPERIVAVDINQYHIYLTRLKLAALAHLPTYQDFFRFWGCADDRSNPDSYYRYLRTHLDEATRNFWEGGSWVRKKVIGPRINYFAENFYNYAKLGYLLRFVHGLCRITRRDPSRLLQASSQAEQEKIFNETIAPFFDNKLVKLIGRQPLVLFSLGIPPKQLEALQKEMHGDIIDLYRERVHRLTCGFPVQDNYFMWQAVARRYDREHKSALPDYLKEDGYAVRKDCVHRVEARITHLTEFLSQQQPGAFNRFILLDSQDWMLPEQIERLWAEIARVGQPGTRVIFRTGSSLSPVESALSPALRAQFVYEEELSRELFKRDRAAIYGGFHLYRRK